MRKLALTLVTALLVALLPTTASANELAVWEKLQSGNPKGYVLLMRHAYAPGGGDPANFKLGDSLPSEIYLPAAEKMQLRLAAGLRASR